MAEWTRYENKFNKLKTAFLTAEAGNRLNALRKLLEYRKGHWPFYFQVRFWADNVPKDQEELKIVIRELSDIFEYTPTLNDLDTAYQFFYHGVFDPSVKQELLLLFKTMIIEASFSLDQIYQSHRTAPYSSMIALEAWAIKEKGKPFFSNLKSEAAKLAKMIKDY